MSSHKTGSLVRRSIVMSCRNSSIKAEILMWSKLLSRRKIEVKLSTLVNLVWMTYQHFETLVQSIIYFWKQAFVPHRIASRMSMDKDILYSEKRLRNSRFPLPWNYQLNYHFSGNFSLDKKKRLTVVFETKWNKTKWKSVVSEMKICSLRNENL